MVVQVRKVGEKKLLHEQQNRYLAEQEAERYRTYSYSQDMYIKALEELLRRNGISYQEECKNLPDINRYCGDYSHKELYNTILIDS